MHKWETKIRLKFKGFPLKISVVFCYEWNAWLIAYEALKVSLEEFNKLDADKQISAIAYGAASWGRMKKRQRVFFSLEDIEQALMNASKAENLQLIRTMTYAQAPEWLKQEKEDKKKES